MAEPMDVVQSDDEIVKKWIKEITTAGSLSKRMRNELNMEQAKGKLVVSELEREMLKLEDLIKESMSNETNRLKTLMVNQLIEINKQEVLANIHGELIKQRGTFLQKPPEDFPNSNEPEKKEVEIQLPDADVRTVEDKPTIERDLQQIEGKIASAEKEQTNIKERFVRHQELLDELELLEEFTKRNEPPTLEIDERSLTTSEVWEEKREHYELGNSSNFNRNSTNGANNIESVLPSRQDDEISRHLETEKDMKLPGTHYGPYNTTGKNSAFVLKTAKRMNRIGPTSDSSKRSKLDLYDAAARKSNDPVDCESDRSTKKLCQMFKPKTPSRLRRIVNETQ